MIADATTIQYVVPPPQVISTFSSRGAGCTWPKREWSPVSTGDLASESYRAPEDTRTREFSKHFEKLNAFAAGRLQLHNADAPGDFSINWSRQILNSLQKIGLVPDRVVASAEGGVGISFSRGEKYADIECLNSNEIAAVITDRKSEPQVWIVTHTREGLLETLVMIRDYFRE